MPWTYPILSTFLGRFSPRSVQEPEDVDEGPARPAVPPKLSKELNYEMHGTYEGPRTGGLYNAIYWPDWDCYSIHVAEGRTANYPAIGKYYTDIEAVQAEIKRVF